MPETVVVDDDQLLERARFLMGVEKSADVIQMALKDLIQRESARRLAALGGSQLGAWAAPRRRPPYFIPPDVGEE
jgi:Bacterial antitoxin of type II TA system, VapB